MNEPTIKLESKTLKSEQIKVLVDEMQTFLDSLESSPEFKATIERLNQNAAYYFISGKPAPKC